MMHVGRAYPYAYEFWQCEVQFWPGYVPRKVFAEVLLPNGDDWDFLLGGVVTDVCLPDAFSVGDPLWSFSDPMGGWTFEFLMHRISASPKLYSVIARLQTPGPAACAISTVVGPEVRTFGGYSWSLTSGPSLPQFNGTIPALKIRAATWSEV